MKILTLVENQHQDNRLKCEHGLSVMLEMDGKKVLFDMGQSDKLLFNAHQLGINLSEVNVAVVSHGHYDHSGGVPAFFQKNQQAKLHIHPSAFKQRFSRSSVMVKENGIPWLKSDFESRIVYVDDCLEVLPNIWLLPNIQSQKGYEVNNPRLVVKGDGDYIPDQFEDELVLVAKEGEKVVVFCGCAHNGIVNILHRVKSTLGFSSFDLVLGGLHLKGQSVDEIQHVIKGLRNFSVKTWAINHCTGDDAFPMFEKAFPNCVSKANGGALFEF